MKNNSFATKAIMTAVTLALLAYFGLQGYRYFADPLTTTLAYSYQVEESVSLSGYVVRREQVLPDDPADHRGILSWLAQPFDGRLREAGSYGYRVEVPIRADAAKDGKVTVRLESDRGLAVYGPRFGRYPFGPSIVKEAGAGGLR